MGRRLLARWALALALVLARQPATASESDLVVTRGELGAGEGRSYSFVLPKAATAGQCMLTVRNLAAQGGALRKSNRPHLYTLAFALDGQREVVQELGRGGVLGSSRKVRNVTGSEFVLVVPVSTEHTSTVHVVVASNFIATVGKVPFEVCLSSPSHNASEVLVSTPMLSEPLPAVAVDLEHAENVTDPPAAAAAGRAPLRILCIDGGGSRGVVPLEMLTELERRSGVRTRDQFDMFCGTSTGSIVAAGLAIADLPVAVCSRLYFDICSLIFGSRLSASQRSMRLRAVVAAVFGDLPCSADRTKVVPQLATSWSGQLPLRPHRSLVPKRNNVVRSAIAGGRSAHAQLRSGGKMFCAVATDMSTLQFRPFVFRSYCPPLPKLDRSGGGARLQLPPPLSHDHLSHSVPVIDALMASTAAPTFFSNCNITVDGEERRLMDGGLCANNPTHFALLEAAEFAAAAAANGMGSMQKDVGLVLSLGCGQEAAATLRSGSSSSWVGAMQSGFDMMQGLFNLMTDTDMTHEVVKRMLRAQGLRSNDAPAYYRFNAVFNSRHVRFDESSESELRSLQMMARDYLRKDRETDVGQLLLELRQLHPAHVRTTASPPDTAVQLPPALSHRAAGPVVPRDKQQSDWLLVPASRKWALLAEDHPLRRWQVSAPLRDFRKATARATGLSGFFSGKHRQGAATSRPPPG